jgi:UDP-galactopyranose mutase
MSNYDAIITFSHLRWDFVYQRPQHLLSRMARGLGRRVFFIEEPVPDSAAPHWERFHPEPDVIVLRPHTPASQPGFHLEQLPVLRDLIRQLLREENLARYVVWLYTPMALPLAQDLEPLAVIYDCMDELSAFLNAPPELLEREAHLLQLADIVFTGGPSLYQAKKDRHGNVHCFPSSVDLKHYAPSANGLADPPDQAALPHPRLGFFGVIDERTDLPLLDAMAKAHPEWQIVMVGPVVKIDRAFLPCHRNIHYLGQKLYAELPAYLSGWDVAILPFARNQATRYISPTKTLEYMAAAKMIVSTPITDVAEPYGDIVLLGDTPAEFIAACERALALPPQDRAERLAGMRKVLSRTSWDATARAMDQLVIESIDAESIDAESSDAQPRVRDGSAMIRMPARHASTARMSPSDHRGAIVIGAGPTGLSAAYHLGADALLLEQNNRVGGWCRSIESNGFTFDFAGHIMFSNDPYVHQLYDMLLGDNVHWQDREAWVYSKNTYTRYPFQGSLYGLPPDVIRECIVGAIEARFGPLEKTGNAALVQHAGGARPNGADTGRAKGPNGRMANGAANGTACKRDAIDDCCADGIMESSAPLGRPAHAVSQSAEPRNFEEFIFKVWGAGIAKHFAIPYNRKLWAVPLAEMETSWLGGRVPLPDLEEMIEGALSPSPKPMGPNARFGYPLRGGFQALMDAWLPLLPGELQKNCRVIAVSPSRRTVTLSTGKEYSYDCLVSTMPLPVLIRSMGEEAPADVRAAAAALRHVSVRCVHLGIGREKITEKHWIYYPEDTVFHRIFVQGNASPECNPPGGFGLTCEITYSKHKPLPCDGEALVRRCVEDCRQVGIIQASDPIWTSAQCDLPYAYVVYDHGRAKSVAAIREWLAEHDIILAGRYSEWEYYNSDHAFLAGRKAAEAVRERHQQKAMAELLPAAWQNRPGL